MKKILQLMLPLLAFGFAAHAQLTYDTSKKDYLNMPLNGVFYKAKLAIINSTPNALEYEWRILNYYLPQGWFDQGACDGGGCFGLHQTGWHSLSTGLAANSSDTVYASIARGAMGVAGCAIVLIEYREKGMASQFIELKHSSFSSTAMCWPLAVNDQVEQAFVSIYPNPTNDYVNIEVIDKDIKTLQLISMVGKQIERLDLSNATSSIYQLSLEALPRGIYFLQLKNEQGKIVGVQRITRH